LSFETLTGGNFGTNNFILMEHIFI